MVKKNPIKKKIYKKFKKNCMKISLPKVTKKKERERECCKKLYPFARLFVCNFMIYTRIFCFKQTNWLGFVTLRCFAVAVTTHCCS